MPISASDLAGFPTDEKVAIIMEARKSGNLGEFADLGDDTYRVTADGKTFIVRRRGETWLVSFKGASSLSESIAQAARLSIAHGSESDISKDYPL